jgi:Mn2+/Fe2+ NRAMP family transporter
MTDVNDSLQYASERPPRAFFLVRFWRALGPGIVTGAADDDPSGIATYSIAGAQLGTTLLWTALFTWPLMAAVQSMCARIGMVTGRGLMAVLSRKFPRYVLAAACVALFAANTLNVGADLSAMADAAQLLTGVSSHLWTIAFGAGIAWATIQLRYRAIADALKWLALVLFVYIAAAIQTGPDWSEVIRATAWPSLPHTRPEWTTLVAILGTTISPYLFFWQTSQEVEEEKAIGRTTVRARRRATREELGTRKVDIGVGTLLSNVAMFFIILTTSMTLHRAGLKDISTSREVAQALRPLAGRFATVLYAIGIIGTGVLSIPTLAGSAAYALAEYFGWREGMDERFPRARAFYLAIAASIATGIALDFLGASPVKALYWSAVLNGLLAPVLLVGIIWVASDKRLMAGQPSTLLNRVAVSVTVALMMGASVAMFAL